MSITLIDKLKLIVQYVYWKLDFTAQFLKMPFSLSFFLSFPPEGQQSVCIVQLEEESMEKVQFLVLKSY